jgi:hypothetical protein
MVEQEYQDNQLFKYPEEYDLYDEAKEKALKHNFKDGPAPQTEKQIKWKVPNFENETKILDDFKARDRHRKKQLESEIENDLKEKFELEMFIHKQAVEYQEYMKRRNKN